MAAMRAALAVMLLLPGCYLSHEAPRDGEVELCTFSYVSGDGVAIACGIDAASSAPCLDAALCICQTVLPDGTSADIDACLVDIVEPRALITFSDYCSFGPPARHTFPEALAGFVDFHGRDLRTTASCAEIPALLEPR